MKTYIKPIAKQTSVDACLVICASAPVGDPLSGGNFSAEGKKQGSSWEVIDGEEEW